MTTSRKLWIATSNRAKMMRVHTLIGPVDADWAAPSDEGPILKNEESITSHIENAISKAVDWSMCLKGLVVSTDGGLVIPGLGARWNSVATKRATGADVPDEVRAETLLRMMESLGGATRACWFIESIAIAESGSLLGAWQAEGLRGAVANSYVPEPGGIDGFWISGLWQQDAEPWKRLWELDTATREQMNDPWIQLETPVRNIVRQLGV